MKNRRKRGTKKEKHSEENSVKEKEDLRELMKLLTQQVENMTKMFMQVCGQMKDENEIKQK